MTPLIEGIGDEVTKFFFLVVAFLLLYFAWRSTSVRDDRVSSRAAVFVIESRRRRVSQHSAVVSILNITPRQQSTQSDATEELEFEIDPVDDLPEPEPTPTYASAEADREERELNDLPPAPSLQSILEEVNDLAAEAHEQFRTSIEFNNTNLEVDANGAAALYTSDYTEESGNDTTEDDQNSQQDEQEEGQTILDAELQQAILDDMDASVTDQDGLRRRRLVFFAERQGSNATVHDGTDEVATSMGAGGNAIDTPQTTTSNTKDALNCGTKHSADIQEKIKALGETEIRVKLKYLNDDLKLVTARLSERLGDFKQRHFVVELADNKLVRLLFNGAVLQPDSRTLKSCGFFDNCVVHCLVHNKKAVDSRLGGGQGMMNGQQGNIGAGGNGGGDEGQGNLGGNDLMANFVGTATVDGENRDDHNNDMVSNSVIFYLSMGLLTACLLLCWYYRIQYTNLFTFYSTTGLVLMTIAMLIMIPLLVLIERDVIT